MLARIILTGAISYTYKNLVHKLYWLFCCGVIARLLEGMMLTVTVLIFSCKVRKGQTLQGVSRAKTSQHL